MSQAKAEWKEAALREYVTRRMTPRQFANHIGYSYSGAITILLGRMWPETPRPEGFMHPWPERAAQSVALLHRYTREDIIKALALKEAEGWSYRQLARYMGVSHCTTHRWVHGNPTKRNKRDTTTARTKENT